MTTSISDSSPTCWPHSISSTPPPYTTALSAVVNADRPRFDPFEYPLPLAPNLLAKPTVVRLSKASPLEIDLAPVIDLAHSYGPYGAAFGVFVTVLRNAEEIARLPFRFAEGWYSGRIELEKLRQELQRLRDDAQRIGGTITVTEIGLPDPPNDAD